MMVYDTQINRRIRKMGPTLITYYVVNTKKASMWLLEIYIQKKPVFSKQNVKLPLKKLKKYRQFI